MGGLRGLSIILGVPCSRGLLCEVWNVGWLLLLGHLSISTQEECRQLGQHAAMLFPGWAKCFWQRP